MRLIKYLSLKHYQYLTNVNTFTSTFLFFRNTKILQDIRKKTILCSSLAPLQKKNTDALAGVYCAEPSPINSSKGTLTDSKKYPSSVPSSMNSTSSKCNKLCKYKKTLGLAATLIKNIYVFLNKHASFQDFLRPV